MKSDRIAFALGGRFHQSLPRLVPSNFTVYVILASRERRSASSEAVAYHDTRFSCTARNDKNSRDRGTPQRTHPFCAYRSPAKQTLCYNIIATIETIMTKLGHQKSDPPPLLGLQQKSYI